MTRHCAIVLFQNFMRNFENLICPNDLSNNYMGLKSSNAKLLIICNLQATKCFRTEYNIRKGLEVNEFE